MILNLVIMEVFIIPAWCCLGAASLILCIYVVIHCVFDNLIYRNFLQDDTLSVTKAKLMAQCRSPYRSELILLRSSVPCLILGFLFLLGVNMYQISSGYIFVAALIGAFLSPYVVFFIIISLIVIGQNICWN